jgi:Tol biopolymer transport system component
LRSLGPDPDVGRLGLRQDVVRYSPDGEWLTYPLNPDDDSTPPGLWAERYGVEAPPVQLVEGAARDSYVGGQTFSPDGRYMAYLSEESEDHNREVWVLSLGDPEGERWRIDTAIGDWALWSHDGNTIFFRGAQGMIRGIEVETDPTFSLLGIRDVFDATLYSGPFDVGPDGQSFLFSSNHWLDQAVGEKKYYVVEDFFQELKEKLGR